MVTVELRTLGDCQILTGDTRIGPQSPHTFALALYLCIERGRPHSRNELQALFFPGVPQAKAGHSLRQTVYKLRTLGLPCSTEAGGTVVASRDVRDDYSALLASGQLPDEATAPLPGTFLPGYWPRISDDYTRWLEAHRDAVNGALRRAYVARVIDRRAVARWDQAELYARACLQIDPLNDEATYALAEALVLSGSKVAGVKLLDRYIEDVGDIDESLKLPAIVLRKRISERLHVSPARAVEPRMVGRESEFRLLATALAESRAGFGRALHVWGEPGIGKTRLVREFLTSALLNGAHSIELGAQPHDLRRPLSTVAELASQLLRATGALGAAPRAIALLRRLVTVDPSAVEPGAPPMVTSPAEMEAQLAAAMLEVLDAITRERPLIIAIEDLHWADSASRRVLEACTADRTARRLLWVLTSRGLPGGSMPAAASVALQGLVKEEGAQFVARYLQTRLPSPPPDLAGNILRLGGGNPFYLRSLCDYYADSGDYESTPPQLRDIVLHRVRGLDMRARTVLSMCAVLGRCASVERVQATLEMPCHELTTAMAGLEAEGLLSMRDGILVLQHDLLSAAVLDETPEIARAMMRRSVALRLESEGEATGELSLLWQAADHWTACGEPEKAKELFKTCSLHAARLGLASEAFNALMKYAAVAGEEDAQEVTRIVCSVIRYEIRDPSSTIRTWLTNAGGRGGTEVTTAFELRMLDVNQHFLPDAVLHVEHMESLIHDHRSSIGIRRLAAAIAIRVADDSDDLPLAQRIAETLDLNNSRVAETDDPAFVRLFLMYHCQFGDECKALETAREIATWTDSSAPSDRAIGSVVNAGIALSQLGRFDEARNLFCRALVLDPSPFHQATTLAHLAVTTRLAGLQDEEDEYAGALEKCTKNISLNSLDSFPIYYFAVRALDRCDLQLASKLLSVLDTRLVTRTQNAHWAMLTALKLRLGTLCEVGGCRESAVAVADWSLRTAHRSSEDDVALAVTLAYSRHSLTDAREYSRRYHQVRRKGMAILPRLVRTEGQLFHQEAQLD